MPSWTYTTSYSDDMVWVALFTPPMKITEPLRYRYCGDSVAPAVPPDDFSW
ncbi:hypothetical protein [Streptomyces longwoodensis]|uniref:hypothetical protein n=1 Tax=Streptomyces longwoodensis TaxID=68231 RepID=UPI0033C50EE4